MNHKTAASNCKTMCAVDGENLMTARLWKGAKDRENIFLSP